MVSSKKPNQEKKPRSDGVNKAGGGNTRSSGSKPKKKNTNVQANAKKEPEVHEISESSSSDSVGEARRDEPVKSNGGGVEDAKMIRFPMNRIRRIMRSDNSAPQIMQDAVFLVNKATV
ncbi:hypothetical protein F2Q68_00042664 [Brassica cretica]|uniref:Transcription factor CBF/NF-Y/archaeal histone domain-containing protein n=1 Tax=Brassica cretica TaxID=69181 RepID=A0A8S9MTS3_BRACR|nr:hypothetical protein F2Q68_00042664 [Brassica cretica]